VDSSAKLSGGEGYIGKTLEEAPVSFTLQSFAGSWIKSDSSVVERWLSYVVYCIVLDCLLSAKALLALLLQDFKASDTLLNGSLHHNGPPSTCCAPPRLC
jgi:hypothetical protein